MNSGHNYTFNNLVCDRVESVSRLKIQDITGDVITVESTASRLRLNIMIEISLFNRPVVSFPGGTMKNTNKCPVRSVSS